MNAGRKARLCAMALALSLFGLTASVAQAQMPEPPDVQMLLPEGSSGYVRLLPGESGVLTYAVKNLRTYALGPRSIPLQFGGLGGNYDYLFEAEPGSRCNLTLNPLAFTISGLALDETVVCRTLVTRAPTSRSDLRIGFCTFGNCNTPSFFTDLLFAGTLPDIALTSPISTVAAGATTAIVRLTISNPSDRLIAPQIVRSECMGFNGGLPQFASPLQVENDFAGACPTAPAQFGCANFTGMNNSRVAYTIGPIPAGGSATCELRLRFRQPLTAPKSIEMSLPNRTFTEADGTTQYDANLANNTTLMGAVPAAAYEYVPVPALGRQALLLLIALMIVGAAWMARSEGVRR